MATPGVMARAGLWSALAFVLNLTWEIAQVRLYTKWLILPPVMVGAYRTLGPVLFGRHNSRGR